MKKILVANRGEIALRIMRTIRKMGLQSVAVFSEADRNAPHVRFADEAVCLGGGPSSDSYLRGDKIIEICKQLGVDGVHPGYGFLSENAAFAQKVEEAGITFIGPSAAAMEVMGSKLAAKDAVKGYNIPMVPGTDGAITDLAEAKSTAEKLGFPVLIKASAGGGGKGMRIVHKAADLEEQMQRAVSEAQAAFGDGSVFIEKYIGSPRHIEIQILADKFGSTVHLFERECSIQRRHQKVIEESPSAIVTPHLRQRMGEAAVQVAKACGYTSTGTVEFLVDENLNFYFLEMNTRLQVEHPVTEMITGLDLVEEQIKIARGEKLSFSQNDLHINGHAIELRVYAEDPYQNFMPSIGTLATYRPPTGEGIRVDDGYEEGMQIPIYYDPMIAKLVAHAEDRNAAIAKLLSAISQYHIEGVSTTLPFGRFVLTHNAFVSGQFDTHFVNRYYAPEDVQAWRESRARAVALMALKYRQQQLKITRPVQHQTTSWKRRLA
ncbi:MAG: acetyl-CoA carboxylase biotin carboxylase subunit [Flavisolibacter sp.]